MTDETWASAAADHADSALAWVLKKLRPWSSPQGAEYRIWTVPDPLAPPAPESEEPSMPMHWIRTQIVAALGPDEEVVHSLNWRHQSEENAALTSGELKAFCDVVRDRWAAFFIGAHQRQALYAGALEYKEVRGALLVQDAPATKPSWPLPTQVSPFAPGAVKGTATSSQALPYEVAHCLQLNTNWRGTSRFRGRLYLGPLALVYMGQDGNFSRTNVDATGLAFGTEIVAGVAAATDYELHVVSQKYATSAAVTGVRTGIVPDSQRRRRRDRPENFIQAWGQPVGASV